MNRRGTLPPSLRVEPATARRLLERIAELRLAESGNHGSGELGRLRTEEIVLARLTGALEVHAGHVADAEELSS